MTAYGTTGIMQLTITPSHQQIKCTFKILDKLPQSCATLFSSKPYSPSSSLCQLYIGIIHLCTPEKGHSRNYLSLHSLRIEGYSELNDLPNIIMSGSTVIHSVY